MTIAIKDGQWWKVSVSGPDFSFRGAVKLTSGEEVPLPREYADGLEAAMRRHPKSVYSIRLLAKVELQEMRGT